MKKAIRVLGILTVGLGVAAGVMVMTSPAPTSAASTSTLPQFGHVFIVAGENLSYSTTYNSTSMPYLTSLANQYGLATHYWSDSHPSIGNYFTYSAGNLYTDNDSDTPSSLPLSVDNIAYEVQQANKTWKDYVEDLPGVSGCGGYKSGTYYVRHDPLEYFTNINHANIVCFSQFATDLNNKALPNLSWLVPNGTDDAHDTSNPTDFDNWLKAEIAPLLASSYFQSGGDGLLIITWDEDSGSGSPDCDTTTLGQGCGGQVETVVISPYSKLGYKSTAGDSANYSSTYDGANILMTMAQGLGLNTSGFGAAAANSGAAKLRIPMSDFFNTTSGSVYLSPTTLSFGNVTVGTTSTLVTTLNNGTSASASVSGIGISPTTSGFTETNNCPSSLAAGSNCTISVTFAPTTAVSDTATLSATAGGSTLTASLAGTGVSSSGGGTPGISLSSNPSSVSVTQGSSTSSSITVTPSGGFTGTVSLSSSCPSGVTCSLSSSSVTISGTTAQSVTLNIGTASTTATGTDTLTVTGTSGSLSSKATVSLTVNAASGGGGGGSAGCPSGSTNYYVSTTGSDSSGNGSSSSPWATIQYASTKIGPGACVNVAAGTYSQGNILTQTSGTSSARLTYISTTPWGAKIVNTSYNGSLNQNVWDNEGSYVTIRGFDISGDAYQGMGNGGSYVQIIANHVHNVLPQQCNSNGGAGIDDHGNYSDDIGNVVNDVANFSLGSCVYVHGIYADRTGGHIWNNIVYHNWANGIQLWGNPQSVTISGNTVAGNGSDGLVYGTDTSSDATSNMLVTDNIFIDNTDYGFDEQGYTGSNNQFIDNLTYGNTTGPYSLQTGTQTGTVESNPLLLNYSGSSADPTLSQPADAALYFELQSSSPAINAGTSTGAPSVDYAGNPRPTGSAWDIGAYQYTGTTSTPAISLSASPSSASVAQGGSTSSTITVTPSGGFTGTVSLSPSCPSGVTCSLSSSSVTISGTTAQSVTLKISVTTLTPTGTYSLTVTGTSGSLSSQAKVSLTVNTASSGTVSISPNPLSFPSTTVNTTSAVESATLTNNTGSALTITAAFTITGPFAFGGTGNCPAVGSTLAAGGTCSISVDFTPTATGTQTGTVTVFDSAGTQTLSLTGTGTTTTAAVGLSASPSSVSVTQGKSTSSTITVTPSGGFTGTVSLSSSCPSGVTCSLSSSSVTISGTTAQSVTLNIGTSSTTATGTDTLTVTGTSGSLSSHATVSLTVNAASTGSVGISPNPLSFPSTTVNTTSAVESATLTNNTGSALTITAAFTITGPFAFGGSGNCPAVGGTLAAGGSCTITVDFKPTTTGTLTGTAYIYDSAGTQTLSLTGTSVAASTPAAASLSPTSLNFGKVKVGTTSAPQTVTLSNTGGSSLTINAITTTAEFAASSACGWSLAAGSKCTISVTFTPASKGNQTGTLSVSDNASGSPQTVSLSGSGHLL